MSEKHKNILLRVLAIVVVIGLSVFLVSSKDKIEHLTVFGYPGIFLVALLSNGTVFFPAPGLAVIFSMGAVFNPIWVGIAGGIGAGLGECTAYLAGFSGRAVVENTKPYQRIVPHVRKYGILVIFILSAIPTPFFDLAGVAAGVLKMRLPRFFFAAITGNIIKMTLIAYAGYHSINLFFGNG
ncbi:MAG: VTT domain-containing protein [Anaerolineales bacterium]|nr:VTT domain-containing protein [Anaerolineales bacterium]